MNRFISRMNGRVLASKLILQYLHYTKKYFLKVALDKEVYLKELTPVEFQRVLDKYDYFCDLDFCESFTKEVLSRLDKGYFRTRLIGFEQDTPDQSKLYVSNHSGMAFPWDAMMFVSQLYKSRNYNKKHGIRILTSPALSKLRLMHPFQIKNLWHKCGGIDATYDNFEALFHQEADMLIYPEGIAGIGKGFNNKYSLQRFATSFIRLALQYKRKIVPVYTINGEYIDPYVYSVKWINDITKKIGIPFIPIGAITLFIVLQPWMFYMAFPARLTYVRGEEIDLTTLPEHETLDKEERIKALRDNIKSQMQASLNKAVEEYGQKPFDVKHLFSTIKKNWKWFPFLMPFGWVFLFSEFERRWSNGEREDLKIDLGFWSWIKFMFKNPFTIFYFIPLLGWIPIAIRGYQVCGKQSKEQKK